PRLLSRPQGSPEARTFLDTTRHKVGGLQRKSGRGPERRQRRKRTPLRVGHALWSARPGEQHTVEIAVAAKPIEERTYVLLAQASTDAPPGAPQGDQPLGLGVSEPQALAQALGILGHQHTQRGEPARGIGRQRERRLELDQV